MLRRFVFHQRTNFAKTRIPSIGHQKIGGYTDYFKVNGLCCIARYFIWVWPRQVLFSVREDMMISQKFDQIREHYGDSCLDVGSGFGDFSVFLKSNGIAVTAIDIVNKGQHPEIETIVFDGVTIPFPAKSFHTSIAMFVLHYSQSQIQLLTELGRVTRSRIIIADDVIETVGDKVLGAFHLKWTPWGHRKKLKKAFHSDNEWRKIFEKLGWRVIKVVQIPRYLQPLYPIHRRLFVLEP